MLFNKYEKKSSAVAKELLLVSTLVAGTLATQANAGPVHGWAAGVNGQILFTSDKGATWTVQSSSIGSTTIYDMDFTSLEAGGMVGRTGRVIKTVDAGNNWTGPINLSGASNYTSSISYADTDPTYGWVADVGTGKIFKTSDGGTSWGLHYTLPTGPRAVDFPTDTTGWAVGNGGSIYKTIDGGASWTAQTSGTGTAIIAVQFHGTSTGWAVGGSGGVIRYTTDGGTNWQPATVNDISTYGFHELDMVSASVGWAVGDYGTIVKTTDGGVTWDFQANPADTDAMPDNNVGFRLRDVSFIDALEGWAVGENGGTILHTTDGGSTWIDVTPAEVTGDLHAVQFMTVPEPGLSALGATVAALALSRRKPKTAEGSACRSR